MAQLNTPVDRRELPRESELPTVVRQGLEMERQGGELDPATAAILGEYRRRGLLSERGTPRPQPGTGQGEQTTPGEQPGWFESTVSGALEPFGEVAGGLVQGAGAAAEATGIPGVEQAGEAAESAGRAMRPTTYMGPAEQREIPTPEAAKKDPQTYIGERLKRDLGQAAWQSQTQDVRAYAKARGITPGPDAATQMLIEQNPEQMQRRIRGLERQYLEEKAQWQIQQQQRQQIAERVNPFTREAIQRGITDPEAIQDYERQRLREQGVQNPDEIIAASEGRLTQEQTAELQRREAAAGDRPQERTWLGEFGAGAVRGGAGIIGTTRELLGGAAQFARDQFTEDQPGVDVNKHQEYGHWLETTGKEFAQQAEQAFPESAEARKFRPGSINWWMSGLGEQAPIFAAMATGSGAGATVGRVMGLGSRGVRALSTVSGMSTMGAIEGAHSYHAIKQRLLEQGYREQEATARALSGAAIVGTGAALLEKFPIAGILQRARPKRRILEVARGAAIEGSTEAPQEMLALAAEYGITGRDPKMRDALQVLEATMLGAGIGAGASAARAGRVTRENIEAATEAEVQRAEARGYQRPRGFQGTEDAPRGQGTETLPPDEGQVPGIDEGEPGTEGESRFRRGQRVRERQSGVEGIVLETGPQSVSVQTDTGEVRDLRDVDVEPVTPRDMGGETYNRDDPQVLATPRQAESWFNRTYDQPEQAQLIRQEVEQAGERFRRVPIDPQQLQTRNIVEDVGREKVDELAQEMRTRGLRDQPPLMAVRRQDGALDVIDGNARLMAAREAGLSRVMAYLPESVAAEVERTQGQAPDGGRQLEGQREGEEATEGVQPPEGEGEGPEVTAPTGPELAAMIRERRLPGEADQRIMETLAPTAQSREEAARQIEIADDAQLDQAGRIIEEVELQQAAGAEQTRRARTGADFERGQRVETPDGPGRVERIGSTTIQQGGVSVTEEEVSVRLDETGERRTYEPRQLAPEQQEPTDAQQEQEPGEADEGVRQQQGQEADEQLPTEEGGEGVREGRQGEEAEVEPADQELENLQLPPVWGSTVATPNTVPSMRKLWRPHGITVTRQGSGSRAVLHVQEMGKGSQLSESTYLWLNTNMQLKGKASRTLPVMHRWLAMAHGWEITPQMAQDISAETRAELNRIANDAVAGNVDNHMIGDLAGVMLAQHHGVRYEGVQARPGGQSAALTFTDPQTRSTFLVAPKQTLPMQLGRIRGEGEAAEAEGETEAQRGEGIFGDIRTRLRAIREGLEQVSQEIDQAQRNEVTGLYGRRVFTDTFGRVKQWAAENNEPFTLVAVDAKNLKQVNDTEGDAAGDTYLQQVAAALQSATRSGTRGRMPDTVFHYGGDEFAILAPGAGEDAAVGLRNRAEEALDPRPIGGRQDVRTGIVADFSIAQPQDARQATPEDMLASATDAMKARKKRQKAEAGEATTREEAEQAEAELPEDQGEVTTDQIIAAERRKLANPELVDEAVVFEPDERLPVPDIAVPVGGQRQAGTFDHIFANRNAAVIQMHAIAERATAPDRQFPNLRLRQVEGGFQVAWGQDIPAGADARQLGELFGYTPDAIREFTGEAAPTEGEQDIARARSTQQRRNQARDVLGPLDFALWRQLHSVEGAAERWAQRRTTGLTSQQMREAIKEEAGTGGFSEGQFSASAKKTGPTIEVRAGTESDTLKGRRLVAAVRRVTGVPQPDQAPGIDPLNVEAHQASEFDQHTEAVGGASDPMVADRLGNDIFTTAQGEPITGQHTGQPMLVRGYQARTPPEGGQYAEGARGPILGPGTYVAPSQQMARSFGSDIIGEPVVLNNPLVITSGRQLARWGGEGSLPTDVQGWNRLTEAAEQNIKAAGHDGVVLNFSTLFDVALDGDESVKRLRELAETSQAVKFPTERADRGQVPQQEQGRQQQEGQQRGQEGPADEQAPGEATQESPTRPPLNLTAKQRDLADALVNSEDAYMTRDGRIAMPATEAVPDGVVSLSVGEALAGKGLARISQADPQDPGTRTIVPTDRARELFGRQQAAERTGEVKRLLREPLGSLSGDQIFTLETAANELSDSQDPQTRRLGQFAKARSVFETSPDQSAEKWDALLRTYGGDELASAWADFIAQQQAEQAAGPAGPAGPQQAIPGMEREAAETTSIERYMRRFDQIVAPDRLTSEQEREVGEFIQGVQASAETAAQEYQPGEAIEDYVSAIADNEYSELEAPWLGRENVDRVNDEMLQLIRDELEARITRQWPEGSPAWYAEKLRQANNPTRYLETIPTGQLAAVERLVSNNQGMADLVREAREQRPLQEQVEVQPAPPAGIQSEDGAAQEAAEVSDEIREEAERLLRDLAPIGGGVPTVSDIFNTIDAGTWRTAAIEQAIRQTAEPKVQQALQSELSYRYHDPYAGRQQFTPADREAGKNLLARLNPIAERRTLQRLLEQRPYSYGAMQYAAEQTDNQVLKEVLNAQSATAATEAEARGREDADADAPAGEQPGRGATAAAAQRFRREPGVSQTVREQYTGFVVPGTENLASADRTRVVSATAEGQVPVAELDGTDPGQAQQIIQAWNQLAESMYGQTGVRRGEPTPQDLIVHPADWWQIHLADQTVKAEARRSEMIELTPRDRVRPKDTPREAEDAQAWVDPNTSRADQDKFRRKWDQAGKITGGSRVFTAADYRKRGMEVAPTKEGQRPPFRTSPHSLTRAKDIKALRKKMIYPKAGQGFETILTVNENQIAGSNGHLMHRVIETGVGSAEPNFLNVDSSGNLASGGTSWYKPGTEPQRWIEQIEAFDNSAQQAIASVSTERMFRWMWQAQAFNTDPQTGDTYAVMVRNGDGTVGFAAGAPGDRGELGMAEFNIRDDFQEIGTFNADYLRQVAELAYAAGVDTLNVHDRTRGSHPVTFKGSNQQGRFVIHQVMPLSSDTKSIARNVQALRDETYIPPKGTIANPTRGMIVYDEAGIAWRVLHSDQAARRIQLKQQTGEDPGRITTVDTATLQAGYTLDQPGRSDDGGEGFAGSPIKGKPGPAPQLGYGKDGETNPEDMPDNEPAGDPEPNTQGGSYTNDLNPLKADAGKTKRDWRDRPSAIKRQTAKARAKRDGQESQINDSVHQIITDLARRFGIGQPGVARKKVLAKWAAGYYWPSSEAIRLRRGSYVATAVHELGHHLHKLMFPRYKRPTIDQLTGRAKGEDIFSMELPKPWRNELVELGKDLYGDRKPNAGYAAEGWAEAISHLVFNPRHLRERAPTVYHGLTRTLYHQHPETWMILKNARERVLTSISAAGFDPVDQYIAHQDGPQIPNLQNLWDDIRVRLFDRFQRAKTFTSDILGKVNEVPAHINPHTKALRANGHVSGDFKLLLEHGPWEPGDPSKTSIGPGLIDILKPVKNQLRTWQNYMVARRVLEKRQQGFEPMPQDPDLPPATTSQKLREFIDRMEQKYPYFGDYFHRRGGSRSVWNASKGEYETETFEDESTVAARFQWFNNWLIEDYATYYGLLDSDTARIIKEKNLQYITFRHKKTEDAILQRYFGGAARRFTGQTSGIRRFREGKGEQLFPPLESFAASMQGIITRAQLNYVARGFTDFYDQGFGGMGRWFDKIDRPSEPAHINAQRLSEEMQRQLGIGFDKEGQLMLPEWAADLGEQELNQLIENLKGIEGATFWKPGNKTDRDNREVTVMRNGQPHFYEVKDKRMFDLLEGLTNPQAASMFLKILGIPGRVFRAGVTRFNPSFFIPNGIRDTFQALTYTQSDLNQLDDQTRTRVEAMRQAFTGGQWYDLFLASGADMAGIFGEYYRPGQQKLDFDNLFAAEDKHLMALVQGSDATQIAKDIAKLGGIDRLNQAFERMNRMGEFAVTYEQAKRRGATEAEAVAEGGQAAADVTLDFQRGGTWIKEANEVIVFLNAAVQGTDKLGRFIADNPMKAFGRIVSTMILPSLATMLLNWDNEDYWAKPWRMRDRYWYIPTGSDSQGEQTYLKIPKPYGLAAFSIGTERSIAYMMGMNPETASEEHEGDPEALDDMAQAMIQELRPSFNLAGIMPMMEVMAGDQGYSFYWENTIVSRADAELPLYMQGARNSSQLANFLGRNLYALDQAGVPVPNDFIPPAKIDYLIRNWFGGLAEDAISLTERTLEGVGAIEEQGDPVRVEDWLVVRRFLAQSTTSDHEAVRRFFDDYDYLNRINQGYGELSGDERTQYRERHRTALDLWPAYSSARHDMTNLFGQLRQLYDRRDQYDPDELEQRANDLYERIVQRARSAYQTQEAIGTTEGGL